MITLPYTTIAARSNRQIQVWLEEYQAPETGNHRRRELRKAIEEMNLVAINQIRGTQGKGPVQECRSYFTDRSVPRLSNPQSLVLIPSEDFSQPAQDPTRVIGGYRLPQLNSSPEKSIPLHLDTGWAQSLQQYLASLNTLPDRSSPEARKLRKQIRMLKDRLGIPR